MLNKAWQALLLNIMKDSIKIKPRKSMSYKSKLIDAAKFYEDCPPVLARIVSAPFTAPVSRRRIVVYSLARKKSPCAANRAKFHKYRRLAFYMI